MLIFNLFSLKLEDRSRKLLKCDDLGFKLFLYLVKDFHKAIKQGEPVRNNDVVNSSFLPRRKRMRPHTHANTLKGISHLRGINIGFQVPVPFKRLKKSMKNIGLLHAAKLQETVYHLLVAGIQVGVKGVGCNTAGSKQQIIQYQFNGNMP